MGNNSVAVAWTKIEKAAISFCAEAKTGFCLEDQSKYACFSIIVLITESQFSS